MSTSERVHVFTYIVSILQSWHQQENTKKAKMTLKNF